MRVVCAFRDFMTTQYKKYVYVPRQSKRLLEPTKTIASSISNCKRDPILYQILLDTEPKKKINTRKRDLILLSSVQNSARAYQKKPRPYKSHCKRDHILSYVANPPLETVSVIATRAIHVVPTCFA